MFNKYLFRKRSLLITFLVMSLMILGVATGVAAPLGFDPGEVLISEIRIDQSGSDVDEYFELAGIPSTSLDGLTYIVIGDGTGASGVIEAVVDLSGQTISGSGFFVAAEGTFTLGTADMTATIDFENSDNVTHLLVETFTGAKGDDLDTNDDGTLDNTPWEKIIDLIALVEEENPPSGTEYHYGPPSIGPDGSFVPGQAFVCEDGWRIGSFSLGIDDTPGAANNCEPPPPPFFSIMEIQGDGQFSSHEGEIVTTSGIVTLITANGRDMWIQDPAGDNDPTTSDGIFVDDRNTLDPEPQVGDLVTITGEVEEQQFDAQLPRTRIDDTKLIEIVSSDNPLPASVELNDLPNESLAEGIGFWEPLEGMLVSVENGRVVAPTTRFGEFGMVTELDAEPGSGYYPQTKQILLESLGPNVVDYNPERILVDDASLDDPIVAMPGDVVRSLTGVVDYTFGMYKLQPVSFDVKSHKLPKVPVSDRSGPKGNVVITTFNVENLFDLEANTPSVVDVIGQVGFDPGSQWGTDPISTKDNTIRRMASVCLGDTDDSDVFDPSVEWVGFPKDDIDGLGTHTTSCGVVDGLFISEYVEGGYNNKAVEIYNGTGSAINLSAGGYKLQIFFNGSPSASTTIQLTGTVAAGDVFVVADDGASDAILAETDQTSTSSFFNGDDAVVLSEGGKDDAGSTPDPDELETQLTKLVLAIQVELELPEIIVVQEVENTAILQVLGDQVNASAGTTYQACSFETSDARGIEVGFLWDEDRVDLLLCEQLSGPDVEAAFGPGSASPGREPLYGKFDVNGATVHIVGNHFKSKGGDDPPYGVSFNRITEVQRKLQAQVVRDFINTILGADPDALVMVTGDLNDFQFGEPGEGLDHPIAILEGIGGGIPLTNLINLEKDAERWTYVYDGNSQVLDHMLVSPAMFDFLVGTDVLHFNAGFADALGADPTTPLRSSDHDALEGRFKIK